ncbi:hypothetical protein N7457_000294 [Penicillium paradoxum]|uniref:uncharacterized protein n=1 Tax=Penicillium paradoxum TaxID=176176 RepID=UPI0025484550|nr:uncharacterized protein N7457_000294 [Penicillium paradoxum]KAJ5793695.1 hypothetical protein N7457_000294 [Penicillium paradoxum]
MGPKTFLTTGLRHLHKPRLLEPGETFIIRFKNSLRGYKCDVWICVVLPTTFSPSRHVNRRPVGAQPVEGEWLTHMKDRVYSVYLPARNMYRWIGLQDIFVLDEKTPNVLQRAERQEEAKVWNDLREIIRTEPGLEFWKNMALQELGVKGKRGKELRIILPTGHEDLVSCGESDGESDSGTEDEKENAEEEEQRFTSEHPKPEPDVQPGPSKVQATVQSFSNSRTHVRSPRRSRTTQSDRNPTCVAETVLFPPHTESNPRVIPKLPPFQILTPSHSRHPNSSSSINLFPTMDQNLHASSTSSTMAPPFKTETATGPAVTNPEEQEVSSPPSIFDMSIRQALQHIVLGESQKDQLIDVFRGAIVCDTQPEYVHIRSYMKDGEFLPRVIELDTPEFEYPTTFPTHDMNNNVMMRVIGDQMDIGQNFKLHAVATNEDLEDTIQILGRIYLQARRFGLDHMVYRTTFKLQVSWNCYPYLFQCKPLLEVAALAFEGCTEFSMEACDYLQAWMMHLLAEAMDLFTYSASGQFWALMRANPNLQEVVLHLRFLAHCQNPEVYGNVSAILTSRGIGVQ